MSRMRTALGLSAAMAACVAMTTPANAQFYFKSKDFTGTAVRGDEAGLGQALPGATPEELRAAMAWNLRAALNVAALQCQFEPTLLTVDNYNAILRDHNAELKGSFDTISKYFARTAKTKKEGQQQLDQFGTRLYSNFSTVGAQYNFCQTAAGIGREALFTPRGTFSALAMNRIRELRNSLVPFGEQRFARYLERDQVIATPRLDAICWNKKGEWVSKKCGDPNWPRLAPLSAANATVATAATVASR